MKRLHLIILLATMTLSCMAQTIGEAFYIYRNDGQFNAFFRDEVISIDYSYEDADGNTYDEIVTQIVNTADSVYKIPLAAIDSVSFVQPEMKLQPNVVLMDEKGMMDYLKSANGMSLTFDAGMPQGIRPKRGDILVCSDFDNPLFNEGFIGKVTSVNTSSTGILAACDSVYDITEIYEQLISIEQIVDENAVNVPKRASGEWISSRNPISFNLGYSHDISNGKVSLSGSVNGTYIATIAYNITREDQYFNVRINHDWQYSAHLNFKCDGGFGDLIGKVNNLPAIRFPMPVPVFKFQISGAPFVKGEGSMELDFSLNSPVHSYLAELTYHNGQFSGSNNSLPVSGDNNPSFDAAFSLNGSLQGGYMVEFCLGTIDAVGSYIRTGVDFYIGPKLTGNFTMSMGTSNPVNYYTMFKDSKLGLSLLTIDYEAFGEASFMGFKTPKGIFMDGSIQTPFYHEWYILPEFSELTVDKDENDLSASIRTTPTRDILFPLELGIGLYDEKGKLKELAFESVKYKHENEGYVIDQSFYSLEREKEYEARPMIKILGGEVSATPTAKFTLEKNILVHTLSATTIESNSAIVGGRVEGYIAGLDDGEVGFYYNTTGNPSRANGQSVYVGRLSNFSDGEFLANLSNLQQDKTYYYCAYYYSIGEYQYGETRSFTTKKGGETTCPDGNHPHMIDLGLPSGTKWACCNVGASAPEDYGNYYAWGETQPKSVYNWDTYQYGYYNGDRDYSHLVNIGSDIAGTRYDAATANWGTPWRMPSKSQCQELLNNTTPVWTTQNGVEGCKFTGPNGGSVFLPAAGSRWDDELRHAGSDGYYWSSTLHESYQGSAYELLFDSKYAGWYYGNRYNGRSVRPVR